MKGFEHLAKPAVIRPAPRLPPAAQAVVDRIAAEARAANSLPVGLTLPIRTERGLNNREHPMARARRVRKERELVVLGWAAAGAHLEVKLTRISPRAAGDDDGDVGALKAVRDQVAELLGIDDGDKKRLRFRYGEPEKGDYAVRIEVRLATRASR